MSRKLILKMHVGAMIDSEQVKRAREAWQHFIESDKPEALIICSIDELIIGEFVDGDNSLSIVLQDGTTILL